MAPPLSIPHGLGGRATRGIADQGRQFATRLVITRLSVEAIVIGLAFHGVAAIRKFFIGWASVPRPQPGPLPRLVEVPIRTIDTLDRALRRASGSVGRVVHAVESPLRHALEVSANRIMIFGGRG